MISTKISMLYLKHPLIVLFKDKTIIFLVYNFSINSITPQLNSAKKKKLFEFKRSMFTFVHAGFRIRLHITYITCLLSMNYLFLAQPLKTGLVSN